MITRDVVTHVIGKGFADRLDESVFYVTSQFTFSRRDMVRDLQCANFIAAVRLAKVLRRLKINTVAQLYRTDPYSLARCRGIGEASLFVAMCILSAYKYDVLKWWGWNDNVVKFSTFKHNAILRASKRKHEVA